tara:strand:+ start:223 stop:567 length:345 start_codon:yes stop_codon:yes gene_type:complete
MDPGPINVVNDPMAHTLPSFNTHTTAYTHGKYESSGTGDWQVINQKTFGNYLQDSSENSTLNNTQQLSKTIHEIKFPRTSQDSVITSNNPLHKYKHMQGNTPTESLSNQPISEM